MKTELPKIDLSNLYALITEGLIEKNQYYHCVISDDWSNEDYSLIKELSTTEWLTAMDEPISKNEKRGIEYLSKLHIQSDERKAVIVGICDCTFKREKETKVEIDTSYPEGKLDYNDLDLQISSQDFMRFYNSALASDYKDSISMKPLIVRCKTLPQMPECEECGGSGTVTCNYCHGAAIGYCCPDCEGAGTLYPDMDGGKIIFQSKIGSEFNRNSRMLTAGPAGISCPTCKGTGVFRCPVCDGNNEVKCEACSGSGKKNNGNKAQKVTRMIEKYFISKRCFLSLPNDDVIEVETIILQDLFNKTTPTIISRSKLHDYIPETTNDEYADSVIKEYIKNPNLFAINFVSKKIDNICSITFTFKSKEFKILVVGNMAFAEELPEISFLENLFKYK